MTPTPKPRIAAALVCTGAGLGVVIFGLAIDVVDHTFPIQARPAFDAAPLSAYIVVSFYRFIAGGVLGAIAHTWSHRAPGIGRRFVGFEIGFIAAAVLRGSLAAWLNAPVMHLALALPIGALAGLVAFAIAEIGRVVLDPPPPARLP